MTKFETMDNVTKNYVTLSEEELKATEGGLAITITAAGIISSVVLVGWKAGAVIGTGVAAGAGILGAGIYNGYRGY